MIKNTIKFIAIIAFVAMVAVVGIASADDLGFGADTVVTINSNNYTIQSGSSATSMVIGTTNFTVTVPTAGRFTLISSDRYLLTNDQGASQTCTSTQNSVVINGPLTVVITPSTTVCTVPVSGGGNPYSAPAAAPVTVTDTTPPTGTSVVVAGGAATTSTTAVTLTLGATGATQMTISNDSAFAGATWETYATSKSWTLTTGNGAKTVYAKFRDAAGNVSTAVSDTITYSAGTTTTTTTTTTPVTTTTPTLNLPYANATTVPAEIAANRTALISYIITLIQARQTSTTTVSGIPAGFQFTTTLVQGSTGNSVKYLQIFLNSDSATSIGNSGRETTYFGAATKAAVGKFQIKYGLVSSASDAGYGLVGPKTREKINSMLGQ